MLRVTLSERLARELQRSVARQEDCVRCLREEKRLHRARRVYEEDLYLLFWENREYETFIENIESARFSRGDTIGFYKTDSVYTGKRTCRNQDRSDFSVLLNHARSPVFLYSIFINRFSHS
ncbi:hypothetical protein X798_05523 [Onchocerca flexuosa]|uniref:Uncharacterized protein n=1 Tax=Onchocerca flexuosa TaxID=387005 RepID=A0A238BQ16_9BILA|nr:hypothetical protein X798_05523 [Onchocerca flexuosa]